MVALQRSAALNVSLICFMLYVSLEQVRALQCFICHTDDNESCEQKQCPNDQVYDRCMTLIYKNPPDGRHIKKECALAPCHLRGLAEGFANFKSNCDSSDKDCVYCCTGDGCNKDGAVAVRPAGSTAALHLICLILSLALSRWWWWWGNLGGGGGGRVQ
ncbi:hypothetical protein TYRP_015639 [Tyrophagus putrescentiae]|nr:hypothetical protein TYRP_015639 [Tyrophagus putrescentiae]